MADLAKLFDPSNEDDDHIDSFVFTFIQPTKSRKITYREQQELLRIALEEHPDFCNEGIILDTIEKGVHYPVIHIKRRKYVQEKTGGAKVVRFANCDNVKLNKSWDLGADVYLTQGLFQEVKRIEPDYACSPRDKLEHRAFILVGVRNVDPGYCYGLERSWRDWTGARTIYHHLHNEHDLCRILFLERSSGSKDVGLFAYLVLVECRCVNSQNRQRIMDFVQRMRVERINTYISIYHDVDAVSPSRIGASVTVTQTQNGFQTKLEWAGKEFQVPVSSPEPVEHQQTIHKTELRHR